MSPFSTIDFSFATKVLRTGLIEELVKESLHLSDG